MAHKHGGGERHEERDDLTGEHRIGDAGQIALACLFAAVWIADTLLFKYTTFLNEYIPSGIRIPIGVILFVLSAYLAVTGLSIVFGEKREEPVVIRKSVFGVVRHPVYLAEILLYLGFLMMTISLAAIVVWVAGILFLHYISRHEEKLLLARFGGDYRQYVREVPMWIPRLGKRKINVQ